MPKYKKDHFLQIDRDLFHKNLSWQAMGLYTHLVELEHQFTTKNGNFFYRTDKDLQGDTVMSPKTHRKFRRELEKAGIIQTWRMHWWTDASQTKQSRKSVTTFRLLI